MTAETHIERIRQALAKFARRFPGPYTIHRHSPTTVQDSTGRSIAATGVNHSNLRGDEDLTERQEAFARYIAACYPEALTAILADHARLTEALAAAQKDAERYRWLRDCNDWYAEPRIDETDGTKWELVMYSPQRITDPSDDDNLDAAIDAAMKEPTNG